MRAAASAEDTENTQTDRAPLRIGILAARPGGFESWELRLFDGIMSDPRFSLASFLIHPHPFGRRQASSLFRMAARLERGILAREPVYVPRKFAANCRSFEYLPLGRAGSGRVGAAAKRVKELKLDLVIRLTPQGLPDEAVHCLPYGEWAFSFSEQRSAQADWFGYESVISHAPSTELRLSMRHRDDPGMVCIASSSFNTKFSAARNAAFIKERAVTLLMRELRRIADTGLFDTVAQTPHRREAPPSGWQLTRYAAALSGHLFRRAAKALRAKVGNGSTVWTLYTGRGAIDDFDPGKSVEIVPAADEIRADPFLLQHEEDCYLFYEAYAPGDRKAHIAVSRFEGDRLERVGVALERDYHLSYPFVFRHEGDLFMMPETNQARQIEIWRCVGFPLKWELYATALHGQSPADSVLTRHGGKWWLFTNLSDHHAYEDHCSELHIFEVDGPALTRIVPHQRNPVIIDSTIARNAGRIFELNGRLYRPSQRNEHGIYGYGLNIMEIDQLDLAHFRERCIRTIRPDFKPGLLGCHHFDAAGGRYVLDARLSL